MRKKLTRSSFSALRETATLLDEREQRAVIGGDYWDDYGVWQIDSSGNSYWTRTSDGGGYYYGDSGYYSDSGGYYGGSGYYSGSDYYGGSGSYTQDQLFNWQGDWTGGYVEGWGWVPADVVVAGLTSGFYNPNPLPGQESLYQGAYDAAFENAASGKTSAAILTIEYALFSGVVMNSDGDFNGNDPGMQAINLGIWQGFIDGKKSYEARSGN